MSRLERFDYDPLTGPDRLRLLKLHPADSTQIEIDCTLFEATLNDGRPKRPVDPEVVKYEALSWCWGTQVFSSTLRIHKGSRVYAFPIVPNLESALRALRFPNRERILWADAVCINQFNTEERNEQVPKMNIVYGQAERVCIWIGDSYENSDQALEFIQSKMLILWHFDKLCENLKEASNWAALINIMKRPWFSRRWVIQEIALAKSATLYCGNRSIDWKDFAGAVSLFVEVESATYRLSEVMRRDQQYNNVPEFFGNVRALGAALLVNATSSLSRRSNSGPRKALLGLEHLISTYSAFRATQPRDTVYALLAISADTIPHPGFLDASLRDFPGIYELQWLARDRFSSRAYPVDYDQPVVEVFREFVEFSTHKSEASRALNIICRPWAPRFTHREDRAGLTAKPALHVPPWVDGTRKYEPDDEVEMPSWISDLSRAPFGMNEHPSAGLRMERMNADPLVGIPGSYDIPYAAAGTRAVNMEMLRFIPRPEYYSMLVQGFSLDKIESLYEPSRLGNIPHTWLPAVGWLDTGQDPPEDFWRTLVADRSLHFRNPPSLYSRACRESVEKMVPGNPLDTKLLINEGQCSTIVAEFLRRVQAVIWNRCLMRTRRGHLGLVPADAKVGDSICVLYGCSVPVVLRGNRLDAQTVTEEANLLQKQELAAMARRVLRHWKRYLAKKNKRAAGDSLPPSPIGSSSNPMPPLIPPKPQILRSPSPIGSSPNPMQPLMPPKPQRLRSLKVEEKTSANRMMAEIAPSAQETADLDEATTASTKRGGDIETPRAASDSRNRAEDLETEGAAPIAAAQNSSNGWTSHNTGRREELIQQEQPPTINHNSTSGTPTTDNAGSKTPSQNQQQPTPPEPPSKPNESTAAVANGTTNGHTLPMAATAPQDPKPKPPEQKYFWRMIGECYVHGMMDGEAIAWQNEKEVRPEIFDLR